MQLIQCDCGKLFSADTIADRIPLEGHPGVYDVGLQCPFCDAFYHSYYEDDELCRMRESMNQSGKNANRSKRAKRLHAATLDNFSRRFAELQQRVQLLLAAEASG